MQKTKNSIKKLLYLREYLNPFLNGRSQIINIWMRDETTQKELNKYMSIKIFKKKYAYKIFDYYINVIKGVVELGDCPAIRLFLEECSIKNVPPSSLFNICAGFRKSLLNYAIEKNIISSEIFYDISSVTDDNFAGVMHQYDEIMKEREKTILEQNSWIKQYGEVIDELLIVSKTDTKGVITHVNNNFCTSSGYSKDELIGKPHSIVRHPNTPKSIFKNLWKSIKEKRPWHGNLINRKKDGTDFYVNTIIFPILNRNGKIVEYMSTRVDLTELYNREKILQNHKKRLELEIQEEKALFRQGPTVIFKWKNKVGWPVEYASSNSYSILGYTKEEFESGNIKYEDIVFLDDRERTTKEIEDATKSKESFFRHKPYRVVTKDNRLIWVDDNAMVIRNKKGEVTHYYGYIQDITLFIETREKYKESQIKLQFYFDTVQTIILALDKEGHIQMINRFGSKLLGYKESELIGTNWFKICLPQPEGMEVVYPYFLEIVNKKSKQISYFENYVLCRDGTKRLIAWQNSYIFDSHKNITQVLSSGMDITETQKTKIELDRKQTMLNISQKLANFGSWEFNLLENELIWSDEVFEIFELDPKKDKPTYDTFFEMVHPDDRELVNSSYYYSIEKKEPYNMEHRVLMRNGHIKYVKEMGKTFYDKSGKPIKSIGAVIDITKQKLAQNKIEESESFLRTIMESTIEGIITINEDGNIKSFNRAAEKLFGYTREEILNRNINILIPKPYKNEHKWYINDYFQKIMGKIHELQGCKKDGTLFPISIGIGEVKFKGERIFTAIVSDLTKQKEAKKAIIEAKERAEEANRAKSNFLANMSHEIRTPMNVIMGMSYLAMQTELNPKQYNYISKVNKSSEMLLGIINDILDFSKIESEQLNLEYIDFSLIDVLEHTANLLEFKTKEKGIELLYWQESDLNIQLIGDPLRVGQILLNLIGNAIKFTKKGGAVVLKIEKQKEDESSILLHFLVIDNGIGMTKEQQSRLFSAFSQADASTTRKYGGSGLGLVISKKLIEMMGGKIWVESEYGVGSTFHFTIPFKKNVKSQKSKKDNHYNFLNDLRVLLVDDNKTSRMIMNKMLNKFGFCVTEAESGLKAIEIIKEKEFDLILSDWKLKEISGVDMIKEIQNNSNIKHQPKVIMITAYGLDEVKEASNHIEVKKFLSKPISFSKIYDAIVEVMKGNNKIEILKKEVFSKYSQLSNKLSGAHILLVEDNEINQELAIELLKRNNISVVVANNGLQALEKLTKESFDGVLMDCQMPIMDGYEATKEIRKQDKFKNLPIIALTANAMLTDREKALEAGMNDQISKPINPMEMFNIMSNWITPSIKLKKLQSKTFKPKKSDIELPNLPEVDIKKGLNTTLNSKELYIKLLIKFKMYQSDFEEKFSQAQKAGNQDEAIRIAHNLKGVSGSIGAMKIYEIASKLEKACKDDINGKVIETYLKELKELLKPLMKAIEQLDKDSCEIKESEEIDYSSAKKIIEKLEEFLKNSDTDAIETLEELKQIKGIYNYKREIESLVSAINKYDFELALEVLKELNKFINRNKINLKGSINE